MCYQVTCSTCGKISWGGCGRHIRSVYKAIPEGRHCLCRAWPGVDPNNPAAADDAGPSSSCTVL